MEQPILNPRNPYVGTMRIFPGTLVKVAGRPRPNATRFAINFQTGPSLNPRDDLALHLSPCFTPPRIVRNSLMQGAWGIEESWGNGSILSPHGPFEIMIMAEHEQFKIAINGSHYCEFRHRIPYQQITHLTIDGDVDIDRISISSDAHGAAQLPNAPAYQQPSAPPSHGAPASAGGMPPYPTAGGAMPMPSPSMYPNIGPSQVPSHYPSVPSMPPGPAPAAASYGSGYPSAGAYPQQPAGPYPAPSSGPHAYPQMPPGGGPGPAASGYYPGGYPQQPHQQPHHQPQPGHSSSHTSTPFGNIPIGGKALGTIAGLGLGAAAGAAALSALNPVKSVKKLMKPKKMFKHKGWGGRSSSSNSSRSSISSRGSFSSNSS